MPSDSNGIYSLPPGYVATTGEVIQASQHNPPLEDVRDALSARLMRSGAGPMTGALKIIDGAVGTPAIAFNTAQTTGFYKTADGVGLAISGSLIAEWKPTGLEILGKAQFVGEAQIQDKAVTLRKLYHPSGPSKILGSNSNAALTITGAADNGAGLIRLSVASTTTFATSQKKTVSDVVGTVEANGTWTITVVDATHIDLQGSAFANAWVSGGTIGGGVDELVLGTGLRLDGTTLSAAVAPFGSFRRKIIKVTGNTGCTVTADAVVLTDGTGKFSTVALNSTVNLATNGGIDAFEGSMTLAGPGWVSLWAICKADGSAPKVLCNYSDTTITTMPTGYTQAALLGHLRANGSNLLMGTWQIGNRAQYVVGLAQCSAMPLISQGQFGDITTPSWQARSISNFVPPTASIIRISAHGDQASMTVLLAPNNSYGAYNSLTNPPYWGNTGPSAAAPLGIAEILLEGTNVYVAASAGGNASIWAIGWDDNF